MLSFVLFEILGAYNKKMRHHYKIVALNTILCTVFFIAGLLLASHAHAQVPGLPCQIYGKVTTSDGFPIGSAHIVVRINGVSVASVSSNSEGRYGIAPNVLIISDPAEDRSGKTMTFTVNEKESTQTTVFEAGALKEVNLTGTVSIQVSPLINIATSSSLAAAPLAASEISTNHSSSSEIAQAGHAKKHSIFLIKRDKEWSHRSINPGYAYSGTIGTISGVLVLLILGWVYYQNYRHSKKQRD